MLIFVIAGVLIPFLAMWFLGYKGIFQSLWNFATAAWTWLVGLVIAVVMAVVHVVQWIGDLILDLLGRITSMALPSGNAVQSVGDWFQLANGFFPVTEGFVAIVFLSGIWLVCLVYRLIKSYIPTLA
jgi:hypothetical protein